MSVRPTTRWRSRLGALPAAAALVVLGALTGAPGTASADPVACPNVNVTPQLIGLHLVVDCNVSALGNTVRTRVAGTVVGINGDRVVLGQGTAEVDGTTATGDRFSASASGAVLELDLSSARVEVASGRVETTFRVDGIELRNSIRGSALSLHGGGAPQVDVAQGDVDSRLRTPLGDARVQATGVAASVNLASGETRLLDARISATISVDALPGMVRVTCTPGVTIDPRGNPPIEVFDGTLCTVS